MEQNQSKPQKSKKFFKAVLSIAVIVLIVVAGFWIFLRKDYKEITIDLPNYSLESDYCGKQIAIQYCQCAFEDKFCAEVGILNQEAARKVVQDNFEIWLNSQKETKCLETPGAKWTGQTCRLY